MFTRARIIYLFGKIRKSVNIPTPLSYYRHFLPWIIKGDDIKKCDGPRYSWEDVEKFNKVMGDYLSLDTT